MVFAVNANGTGSTNLYNFSGAEDDGSPVGSLVLSGNSLYGVASGGGPFGSGAIFALNTDGTGYTNIHNFAGDDGWNAVGSLVLSGNTLYGTAEYGGTSDNGTVFAVNTNGAGFSVLHNFSATSGPNSTNSDGASPYTGLILSGNTLYGTTCLGGSNGVGTVFAMSTNGSNYTVLHTFGSGSDGFYPKAPLFLSGGTLYGTAQQGGANGLGTLFALNTNGTGFTVLHTFIGSSDGEYPASDLVVAGNTLYGTDVYGGTNGTGSVFGVYTNGNGFTNLYSFSLYGLKDGASLGAGLILSGNTLYGTAQYGGAHDEGAVFMLETNGSGFSILHSFSTALSPPYYVLYGINSDGAHPTAGLVLSGNILYGTAPACGDYGSGTAFSLSLPAPSQLSIISIGGNVVLTWPTNATGFSLQFTTNLSSAVWSSVLPAPVIINGQNTITNPASDKEMFYRLSH